MLPTSILQGLATWNKKTIRITLGPSSEPEHSQHSPNRAGMLSDEREFIDHPQDYRRRMTVNVRINNQKWELLKSCFDVPLATVVETDNCDFICILKFEPSQTGARSTKRTGWDLIEALVHLVVLGRRVVVAAK